MAASSDPAVSYVVRFAFALLGAVQPGSSPLPATRFPNTYIW